MTRATIELVDQMTRALGRAIATPEWVSVGGGRRERADVRVWRWTCPVCSGGADDPDGIWRPLAVWSDGGVQCEANDCELSLIAQEVAIRLDVEALLRSLEAW
jgi:hypothetical protein